MADIASRKSFAPDFMASPARRVAMILAVAALYYLTARLGLLFAIPSGTVTPVWPPTGVALAAVLFCGRKIWLGIWLGAFAANLWSLLQVQGGAPEFSAFLFAAGIGIGAVLTALLGAALLRHFVDGENPIETVRGVCLLMGLSGVVCCVLSATNGTIWLVIEEVIPWSHFGSVWMTWWLGDTAGVFVFAPLLLAWLARPSLPLRARWAEVCVCFTLLLAASYTVFVGFPEFGFRGKVFDFAIIPFLVWPAMRFGLRGATAAMLVVTCLAVWGTVHARGPYILPTMNESLLALEFFLSIMTLAALCIAAGTAERHQAESGRRSVLDDLESSVSERTASLVKEIAERQTAEGKLADREARLRTIVDSEPECVKLLAADGTLLEMNPAGLAMIEADSLAQVQGAKMGSLLHPEHRASFVELTRRVFAGESGQLEFAVTGLKGGHRWLTTHAVPLRGPDGGVQAMLGITRDITERKRAEDALRRERDFSATVIDGLPGIFYLVDPERRFRRWNKNFETVTGYTADELWRMDASQLFPPSELPRIQQNFLKVLETGSASVEALLQPRDGEPAPYFFTGLRVMLDETPCMAGVGIDVTDRRRSSALIDGQKAVLEMIAKGVPLSESLTALLRVLEAQSSDMLCSILLLDRDGIHLRHGAAPSLPEAFCEAIDGLAIGPRAGSCGTAAFLRAQVIVEDIATDPLWADFRAAALPHGLRACWSTPIFDPQKNVLGTFAIYYRQPRLPTEQHRRLIDIAAQTAAIAIVSERAQSTLRESESRHRQLIDANIIGVMVAYTDGRITEANDLFLRMVGYTREELQSGLVRWDAMTPPEWREVDEQIKAELIRAGRCAPVEKEYLRKDGSRVPILASVAMLEATDGACICLIEDLTGLKRGAAALRESESRFRTLFEQAPLGVAEGDIATARFISVNKRYADIVGYPIAELMELTFADFTHPDDVTKDLGEMQRLAAGEIQSFEMEKRYVRKDGAVIWVNLTVSSLAPAGKKPLTCIAVFDDITARKEAEDALRASEARYRTLFESASDGIMVSNEQGRFVDVNTAACQMMGYTRQELLKLGSIDILAREEATRIAPEIARLQASEVVRTEWQCRRKDGAIFPAEVGATRLPNGLLLGVVRDITERKRAEAVLRLLSRRLLQAEEGERRRIAKELHDSTAQDLVAVILNLGMLRDCLPPLEPQAAQIIEDSTALLENCTNDIRTLSYLLHPPRLEEQGLPAALIEYAAGLSRRTDLRVRVEAAPDFGRLTEEREIALFRVAQESLGNVFRHAQSDAVTIRLAMDDGSVVIEIEDYGRGMTSEAAARSGKRGIGIAGMRERLQFLGGRLEIESGSGGTTVRAVLPMKGESK